MSDQTHLVIIIIIKRCGSILRRDFICRYLVTRMWCGKPEKYSGKVPYPLLNIPQANQTYSYQIESYNMMNFLEFVTDQYTSLLIDHTFNGFFFNKLPLTKHWNIREMVTFKALYGNVTKTNDPANQSDLFKLPG